MLHSFRYCYCRHQWIQGPVSVPTFAIISASFHRRSFPLFRNMVEYYRFLLLALDRHQYKYGPSLLPIVLPTCCFLPTTRHTRWGMIFSFSPHISQDLLDFVGARAFTHLWKWLAASAPVPRGKVDHHDKRNIHHFACKSQNGTARL